MQVIAKAIMPEPSGASPEGCKEPFSPSAAAAVKKRTRMVRVIVSSQAPPPPPPPPLNPGGDDADSSQTEDEESSSSEDLSESGDERCANVQLPKKPRRPKSAYRFFFLRERRRILKEFAEERERRRDRDDGSGSHEGDGEATTGQHEQIRADIVRPHGRPSKRTFSPRFGFGETSGSAFGHVVASNPDPDSDFLRRGEDSSKTEENVNDEEPCCEPEDDEIVGIIGERWRALASQDPRRLARCQKMAEREMDRYKLALKEYSEAVACTSKQSKQDPQDAMEPVVACKLPVDKSMQKRPRKTFEISEVFPKEPATSRGGRRLIDGCPMPRRVVNMAPPSSPAGPRVQRLGSRSSLPQCPPVLRHLPGAPSRFGNGARTPSSLLPGYSPLPLPPMHSPHPPRRATSVTSMYNPPRPRVDKDKSAADVSLPRTPGLSSTGQAA